MRYAVLGGGKRLRPIVVLAAAEAVGGAAGRKAALPAACAVELLHAYTLVHDDLPAMDDDAERRGKPTVHIAFGEATAILAGDGLLTMAFTVLGELGENCAAAVLALGQRVGAIGLLAGQCRDLEVADGKPPADLAALERIHLEKTGMLFAAAAELGAIAAGASIETRLELAAYGAYLGIAFQHADDLDDGDQPAFAADARRRLGELVWNAKATIRPLGPSARMLVELVEHVGASAPTP
jgi:geranylgeranyl pyrophosphate synthase